MFNSNTVLKFKTIADSWSKEYIYGSKHWHSPSSCLITMDNFADKRIIFTGGGTAGHVVPNLALIAKFTQENWDITYVGSKLGLEKELITKADIKYFSISTGKLRRYFSWQNFLAPAQILLGIIQAWQLCWRLRPRIVFSKGGFVSFPVVFAAWLNRVPVIIHESDLTPGLANRLSFPFCKKICVTVAATQKYITDKREKVLITGTPIRSELFHGDAELGRKICRFKTDKKIILVQGGGLGSDTINKLIRALLPKLLPNFQIVHSCGKGKLDANFNGTEGYRQFEYITDELPHILASADLVISRAGANSIYELIALKKPHILLPLSMKASRGDQLSNAKYWSKLGLSRVIFPEELNPELLYQEINRLIEDIVCVSLALNEYNCQDSTEIIYSLIDDSLMNSK